MSAALFFGDKWDSPYFDNDPVQVVTPVGRPCLFCDELIRKRDRGLLQNIASHEYRGLNKWVNRISAHLPGQLRAWVSGRISPTTVGGLAPIHVECSLRMVLGSVAHLERRCICYGAAEEPTDSSTKREQALAVVAILNRERAERGREPIW